MPDIDTTHDPKLRSFVESANDARSDFPIQNLPLGVFRHEGAARVGIAIGNRILDVASAWRDGLFAGEAEPAAASCTGSTLNPLMALGRPASQALRRRASELLRDGSPDRVNVERHLVAARDAEMLLPADIGDYTDFYASIHHATNVGSMFRPDNPLLPNYKWVPIGYHGRASSIVASGASIRRPSGQTRDDQNAPPVVGPTRRLDYELEVGAFVGRGNALGATIPIESVRDHIFGLCLVNDWSARDLQAWEYQPLGPFLAKNFATTISPWLVTLDALEPFRAPRAPRPADDPAPLPYLEDDGDRDGGAFDITLEVLLSSRQMRERGLDPVRLSRGRFRDMYWTLGQMLAHHASGGCNLRPGDLIASGTVSGTAKDSRGCMLELTWRGTEPLTLPTGESRRFLEDGDEVVMRGWCERDGFARIGFGECAGTIVGR